MSSAAKYGIVMASGDTVEEKAEETTDMYFESEWAVDGESNKEEIKSK